MDWCAEQMDIFKQHSYNHNVCPAQLVAAELVHDLQHRYIPAVAEDGRTVSLEGLRTRVSQVSHDPRVCVIDRLVTAEEASHITRLAMSRGLKNSQTPSSKQQSVVLKEAVLSDDRTSTSCRVDRTDPVVLAVVERLCLLIGPPFTPWHSEAVQVVHYDCAQQYKPHVDWFDPKGETYATRMAKRGQRLVSVFVYLADVEADAGGQTHFPLLDIGFTPVAGRAVLWYNQNSAGEMDQRTLHAGMPVTKGEKWGMNVWFRESASPSPALS
jgi:prolyl 4-hydroxylase